MQASVLVDTNANGQHISLALPGPSKLTHDANRFKLFLEPKALRSETEIDPRLPRIPVSFIPMTHSHNHRPKRYLK